MTKYAVLCAGEDCWTEWDDYACASIPMRFNSRDEALAELNEHVRDMADADMDFDTSEYEIVECDDEGNISQEL